MKKDTQPILASLFLGGGLAAVYLATLAPGLTWANDGADGGDLITAAATGGIAHPTGYPVYLILARLFQLLPAGSLAYRTNLLSALAMVLTSLLVFALVKRELDSRNAANSCLSALISGFAFGFSPLVWSQAVITEVYALNAFFVVLVLYLSTISLSETWRKPVDAIIGLTLGLGIGIHATILLLLPAVALVRSIHPGFSVAPPGRTETFWARWRIDWAASLRICIGVVCGWMPHLLLPYWAASKPPVDWGYPLTWNREWWLVSGQLYRGDLFSLTYLELWTRIRLWAALLIGQFSLPGLLLGVLGLTFFFVPSRLTILSIWNLLIYSWFAINYNTADWYVYLIPAFLSVAIWVGFGIHGLMNSIPPQRRWMKLPFSLLLLFLLLALAVVRWPQVDASRDERAEDFGHQVMAEAPPDAFIFVQGDRAIFALWYFHYTLHQRPDLVVIAPDLLSFDWYQEVIRSTYPQLNLPGQFPWPIVLEVTNPTRPACYILYLGSAYLRCLNTHIKTQ